MIGSLIGDEKRKAGEKNWYIARYSVNAERIAVHGGFTLIPPLAC